VKEYEVVLWRLNSIREYRRLVNRFLGHGNMFEELTLRGKHGFYLCLFFIVPVGFEVGFVSPLVMFIVFVCCFYYCDSAAQISDCYRQAMECEMRIFHLQDGIQKWHQLRDEIMRIRVDQGL
jgi:hypothetical protein